MTLNATAQAALHLVAKHDPKELAALAGGLTLIPKNLHHLARLECLAVCVIAGHARGRRLITRAAARKILNGALAEWLGSHDDPCESLATEAFTYNGGTHVLIAPDAERLFALRLLATMIAQSDRLPESFVSAATGLIQGVCRISNLIVSRASLARNLRVPDSRQDIDVPPGARLEALLASVRFDSEELESIMAETMLRAEDLASLCILPGSVALNDWPKARERLARRPIFRLEADFVVIAPHRLVWALVHRLLVLAFEMDVDCILAEEFHKYFFLAVDRSLEKLGLRLASGGLAPCSQLRSSITTHAIYQCDSDKAIHVAMISDALDPGSEDDVGRWSTDEIERELVAVRARIPSLLRAGKPPIEQWFSLIIVGGMGRYYITPISQSSQEEASLLIFKACDIETIVLAEGTDRTPLLLWKYAQALRELNSRAKVFAWSPIDKYALWRQHGRSFATLRADVVNIASDVGRILREDAIVRHDWHAVPAHDPSRTVEVVLADGPEQPIYVPRSARKNLVEIVVERPGMVIWVVSIRADLDEVGHVERNTWSELGHMIAYWLAEFSAELVSELEVLASAQKVVLVEYGFVEMEVARVPAKGYELACSLPRTVRVTVYRTFVESYDDTNALEREFAGDLVRALLSLTTIADVDAVVRNCMDKVAPFGVKRMMHPIDTACSPEFIGAAQLPLPRYPHAADLTDVRRWVLQTSPPPNGILKGEDAVGWLNEVVGVSYRRLQAQLASLDAPTLLTRLLLNNESLVHEDAIRDLTLAPQLACYRHAPTMLARLMEQGPRHATASMVTRFLIEHVTAEPPTGSRALSNAEFDVLLALGCEIVRYGVASDIACFELADTCVRMEHGDLVIDRATYEEAAQGALLSFTREQVDREQMRDRILSYQRRGSEVEAPAFADTLNAATREEFGVSIYELGQLMGEAIAFAQEQSAATVVTRRAEFALRISERLAWKDTVVNAALEALTLSPRSQYRSPPTGFQKGDIWPWRFNRGLSYIRRPFVLVEEGNDTCLYFTPGHVYRAANNLFGLMLTGRLKARSKALSQAMGHLTKEASDSFNEEVAQVLRHRGFLVRTEVKQVGRSKIADKAGSTLGDIDVLCIDPARRRIIAIECKDFQMARMPHEVRADLDALFISTGHKRCAQDKHLRRIEWVREHRELVLKWMGIDAAGGAWSVEGAFVFSVALISPLLGRAKLPAWTLRQLREETVP